MVVPVCASLPYTSNSSKSSSLDTSEAVRDGIFLAIGEKEEKKHECFVKGRGHRI